MGERGRTVKVSGVSPLPERENAAIIAGSSSNRKTGEIKPGAIHIDEKTMIVSSTGKRVSPARAKNVEEGKEVIVVGKKNKRGAIKATCLLV